MPRTERIDDRLSKLIILELLVNKGKMIYGLKVGIL